MLNGRKCVKKKVGINEKNDKRGKNKDTSIGQ